MSKRILIGLLFFSFATGYAQKQVKTHPKDFYIIDSIKPELFDDLDRALVDSSLTLFHQAASDSDRIKGLFIISENCFDLKTWRPYNFLIINICEKKLSDLNMKDPEKNRYKYFLASAFNNEGYAISESRDHKASTSLYLKSLNIRRQIKDYDGIGVSLGNIASNYDEMGDILNALKFHELAYKYKVIFSGKRTVATALNNLATIYQRLGDMNKAIDYFHRSYRLFEELKDSASLANLDLNLADVYEMQGDYEKTIELSEKSLSIYSNINFLSGKARALQFCGNAYMNVNRMEKAKKCYFQSRKIYDSLNDHYGIALITNNLGYLYKINKQYDKALELYFESLKFREEFGVKSDIFFCLNNIGSLYYDIGDLPKAKIYALRANAVANEDKLPENLKRSAGLLKRIYNKEGNYKLALEMMELAVTMKDSLRNEQTEKNSYKQQVKYLYDKQQAVFETEQKK